ncbi:hypothetical protein J7K97_01790, partial [Candidatus Aerophobetes bacterium]|nr:hypothetical protein [Candidatus Aerophobetes bacterium]
SSHGSHGSHSSHSSHGSHGSHASHYSCDTGCPFVAIWDGEKYVLENNILPQSENPLKKGTIVEDLYKLEVLPKPKDAKYLIQIYEFENEHSRFNNFELIRVQHPKEFNIGVIDNRLVFYKKLYVPASVKAADGKDWTKTLSEIEDANVFKGKKGDVLEVKFNNLPKIKNCCLVMRSSLRANRARIDSVGEAIEKNSASSDKLKKLLKAIAAGATFASLASKVSAVIKWSININMLIKTREGRTKRIGIVHPRERVCLNWIDISKYIKRGQNDLELELEWTHPHNLSFIGICEYQPLKSDKNIKIEKIRPTKLIHSEYGEVDLNSLKKNCVELIPGQFITLEFPYKEGEKNLVTSFIFKCRGYYTKYSN